MDHEFILMECNAAQLNTLLDALEDGLEQGVDSDFKRDAQANKNSDDIESVASNISLECIYLGDSLDGNSGSRWDSEESCTDLKQHRTLAGCRQLASKKANLPSSVRPSCTKSAVAHIMPVAYACDSDAAPSSSKGASRSIFKRWWPRLPHLRMSSPKACAASTSSGLSGPPPRPKEAWA